MSTTSTPSRLVLSRHCTRLAAWHLLQEMKSTLCTADTLLCVQSARVALLLVLALLLVATPASAASYGNGGYGYGSYGGRKLLSTGDFDFEPALTHGRGLLASYGSGYGGYGTYGRRRLLSEPFQPRRSLLAGYGGGGGYGYGY